MYCFVYVFVFLLVLSLLAPSDNSIAVSNNNDDDNNNNNNVIQKEAKRILKYKDLTIEIQRMLNGKTRVIPVIIGATGTISK
jgi:nucleoside permease NupC